MTRVHPIRMVEDETGRFAARPLFAKPDMDEGCERIVSGFLAQRHGAVRYPLSTDDLTALIERDTEDLDLYADLSPYGRDVEGMTLFAPGRRPSVKISGRLTASRRQTNRYRSTLAHEYAHVVLHAFLYEDLAETAVSERRGRSDWMEWQANYAAFALLMPKTALAGTVAELLGEEGLPGPPESGSAAERHIVATVRRRFAVSPAAARIRLDQHGHLQPGPGANPAS